MRTWAAFSAGAGFVLGAGLGVGLGIVFFAIALLRAARPVHADGVVCRAELVALDGEIGARLAGPAIARFSGAFGRDGSDSADVLGLLLRLRRPEHVSAELDRGDQDLLLGTFESFRTAARDRDATDATDYLNNRYSSVARWWLPGYGPATLRLARRAPATSAPPGVTAEAPSRAARLHRALSAGRVTLVLTAQLHDRLVEIAEVHLLDLLDHSGHRLHGSMFLCGRGVRAVGFRNGLRATLYPMSQTGRRLRGR